MTTLTNTHIDFWYSGFKTNNFFWIKLKHFKLKNQSNWIKPVLRDRVIFCLLQRFFELYPSLLKFNSIYTIFYTSGETPLDESPHHVTSFYIIIIVKSKLNSSWENLFQFGKKILYPTIILLLVRHHNTIHYSFLHRCVKRRNCKKYIYTDDVYLFCL